jgi:hypothetical protein
MAFNHFLDFPFPRRLPSQQVFYVVNCKKRQVSIK